MPPWLGVVSLLDMLRFAAEKFYKLSEELLRVGQPQNIPPLIGGKGTPMGEIRDLTKDLGLDSAHDQIMRIFQAGTDKNFAGSDIAALFADLHRRVHDDLKRKLVYCVESGRAEFCDPKWLAESPIASGFPTALKEIQAAGRCYAFGEGTGSAFHSMRALEVALGVLARRFGVDFHHPNWQPMIEEIESKIRDLSNAPKSPQRLEDEKFFGGLARHFMFLKNGWRNHVMHARDNYPDREARQIIDHVTDLLTEMTSQLREQEDEKK